MSKHTPGPWFVYDMDGSIGTVEASDGSMVAQAQMCGTLREPDNDRRKANARLIAAAPELLQACIEMLELSENWPGIAHSEDLKERASAAIAKATGEKQ